MDRDRYESIVSVLNSIPLSACPHLETLSQKFNVSVSTIFSIHSQEVQWRVKSCTNDLKAKIDNVILHYLAENKNQKPPTTGLDMLEMCFDINLPPCHILRQVLSTLPLELTRNKKTISDLFKDPQSLFDVVTIETARTALEQLRASHSHQLPIPTPTTANQFLARLALDISRCVDCDSHYGPASDVARRTAGEEYEDRLYESLRSAGIPYETEKALRDTGHIKTPDARLKVPIAVKGRIVCWIDSKATFGDDRQHAAYTESQYERYSNRYGPGMVIYWHGYLSHLQQPDNSVYLVDRFPGEEDIETLPRLPLKNFSTAAAAEDVEG